MLSHDFLYIVDKTKNIDEALDIIYSTIDDLAIEGKFTEIDDILEGIEVAKIPIDLLLGFLTASYPMRNQLQHRNNLFRRIKANLIKCKNTLLLIEGLE